MGAIRCSSYYGDLGANVAEIFLQNRRFLGRKAPILLALHPVGEAARIRRLKDARTAGLQRKFDQVPQESASEETSLASSSAPQSLQNRADSS